MRHDHPYYARRARDARAAAARDVLKWVAALWHRRQRAAVPCTDAY